MAERWTPYINYEEITLAANGMETSSPQKFRNTSRGRMWAKYLLFDRNSLSVNARFGVRGGAQFIESFAHMEVLHNLPQMDAATDGAFPLLRLDRPFILPASQSVQVELEDTVGGGDRVVNAAMIGRKLSSGLPFFPADRVTVPTSGSVYADLQADQSEDVEVSALSLRVEETGTAAKMRGLKVRVRVGGTQDWSPSRIPANLHFPHRNAAASVYALPGNGIPLEPTEGLQFELLDLGAVGGTVYLGMIGYLEDRG
jgi:hypothetical protein